MILVKKKAKWEGVGCFDEEDEERSRIHAGNYIF